MDIQSIPNDNQRRGLDAAGLLHDVGIKAQAVALTMWKHEIVPSLDVCQACGRLPARTLPMFGARCEVAVEQWELTQVAMRRLVAVPDDTAGWAPRAVGRAPVPPRHR
ncbi:MAG: hypothetical protein ACRDTM_16005 [Micromonosporaceae bacterium]